MRNEELKLRRKFFQARNDYLEDYHPSFVELIHFQINLKNHLSDMMSTYKLIPVEALQEIYIENGKGFIIMDLIGKLDQGSIEFKKMSLTTDDDLWRIETLQTGLKVLWLYQTKLVAIPKEERWKGIPIIHDEQKFALKILESKNFKRPHHQKMNEVLGRSFQLYGGRKGFVDLMLQRGHQLEAISQWMGHTTLGRTWRDYKDRRDIIFSLPA